MEGRKEGRKEGLLLSLSLPLPFLERQMIIMVITYQGIPLVPVELVSLVGPVRLVRADFFAL
jgi:hypothetical protein